MPIILQPLIAVGALLLLFVAPRQSHGEQQPDTAWLSQLPAWRELHFVASTLPARISVSVRVAAVADPLTVDPDLAIGCPEAPPATGLMAQTVDFVAEGPLVGDTFYAERSFFTGGTLAPYQRIRWRNDDGDRWLKSYCWQPAGVERTRMAPAMARQGETAPVSWSRRAIDLYPYPANRGDCRRVLDANLLLYFLSTRSTGAPADEASLCVFGKKQLHLLTITSRTADSVATGQPLTISRISVHDLPPADEKAESFSFFGLKHDLEVAIDPATSLPLWVRGRARGLGMVTLQRTGGISWDGTPLAGPVSGS
ncbi:MAG: hypothetical protein ACK5PS_11200 [Desulfopila sp.]